MDVFELMERYYDGHLSAEEKQSFEARLNTDSDFREEYELYTKVRRGLQQAGEAELRARLKKMDAELPPFTQKKNIISINKLLAVAAAVIVLIVSSYFIFGDNFKYKDYEVKEIGLPVLMSDTGDNSFDRAMSYYKQKNYKSSLNIINKMAENNPINDTLIYFKGINNYQLKNYKDAALQFETVAKSNSKFREKAQYRLALSHLRLGDKVAAGEVLKEINDEPSHAYNEMAGKLIKEL